MYRDGLGVPQDDKEAIEWFRKAARQGYIPAYIALGMLYRENRGIPKDRVEAIMWYRDAAEKGDGVAWEMLGRMHLKGDGVPEDYAEVVRCFRKAAEWGYPPTLKLLSGIYVKGRQDVPKDLVESLKWAILAANRGDKDAQEILGSFKKVLSPDQIDKAQKDAEAWADTHWKDFYPVLGTIPKQ